MGGFAGEARGAVRAAGRQAGRDAAAGRADRVCGAGRLAARLAVTGRGDLCVTLEAGPVALPALPRRARLVVVGGGEPGRVVLIGEEPVVVGRGPEAGARFPEPEVSRSHARFRMRSGRLEVEDLGSRNGTLVNGGPIRFLQLCEGDRLALGKLLLRVVLDDEVGGAWLRAVYAEAARDQESGLLSAPAFRAALDREAARQDSRSRPVAVVIVELAPRGGSGLPAGALRAAGAAVTGALGPGVEAGRLGDARLAVLLPESLPSGRAAERVRCAVGAALPELAVVVGLATDGGRSASAEELLRAAENGAGAARLQDGARVGRASPQTTQTRRR